VKIFHKIKLIINPTINAAWQGSFTIFIVIKEVFWTRIYGEIKNVRVA